ANMMAGAFNYLPKNVAYRDAKRAAVPAVRFAPNLAETHTSLATVANLADWDLDKADQEFRAALALNPRYALAHSWYGKLLNMRGRDAEGIKEGRRAVDLDPLSAPMNHNLGQIY